MTKLKTVNIKGKQYVEVNERLRYFRENYPNYSLTSEVLEKTSDSILILATISNAEGKVLATGMAEEMKADYGINKTSYVENGETSAWGRALGNFGIGIDASVASANEVHNAIKIQNKVEKPVEPEQSVMLTLDIGDDNWVKVMKYIVANKKLGLTKIVDNLSTKYKVTTKIKNEIKKSLQDA